jgi:hypothetical protein
LPPKRRRPLLDRTGRPVDNAGTMGTLLSMLLPAALMLAVVVLFRLLVRRPRGLSCKDPPGVRTVVTFQGDDPDLFCDDREDEPLVGVRLFAMLCQGLCARGMAVENIGRLQNAQAAECAIDVQRLRLVLEWIDERWVLGVEWLPEARAEKRHLTLTHDVFSPSDSPGLRHLLGALDDWLKSHPRLSDFRWHRKEDWLVQDTSRAAEVPFVASPAADRRDAL